MHASRAITAGDPPQPLRDNDGSAAGSPDGAGEAASAWSGCAKLRTLATLAVLESGVKLPSFWTSGRCIGDLGKRKPSSKDGSVSKLETEVLAPAEDGAEVPAIVVQNAVV